MAEAAYDRIGLGYSAVRQPEPKIAARLEATLGDAKTVLNVGAGTGLAEMARVARERVVLLTFGRRVVVPRLLLRRDRLPRKGDAADRGADRSSPESLGQTDPRPKELR
jgi:hypothetical protein